jgi:hypothetical protein
MDGMTDMSAPTAVKSHERGDAQNQDDYRDADQPSAAAALAASRLFDKCLCVEARRGFRLGRWRDDLETERPIGLLDSPHMVLL